jgi:A/G-specific adenine glycosylase
MSVKQQKFILTVKKFYTENGRHDLPWRQTTDPYRILVSEIMLQQTQVARVVVKYKEFLQLFPTVEVLAKAPLGAVLSAWQGLGYNRRAKMLHHCAQTIVSDYNGQWPTDITILKSLPGIGPYTASAVGAFAFNIPSTLIETNVRTVYIYHFFKNSIDVTDAQLLPIITDTLDYSDPRSWYYALMDYGSHLKQAIGNKNKQSKHYTKQSKFAGSDRQVRGAIIRTLSQEATGLTLSQIKKNNPDLLPEKFKPQLDQLLKENMVTKTGPKYTLPV